MKNFIYICIIIISTLISSIFSSDAINKINKSFIRSGSIESIIDEQIDYDELILVQLDISNDSLLSLINFNIPKINLNVGLGSYHRIFPREEFNILTSIAPDSTYRVIKRPYDRPDNSREYWIELKQGSQTHGTYTEDEAISYTCDCVDGASDCVKLGWDSWYNPFDYWGEAWWAFTPPTTLQLMKLELELGELNVMIYPCGQIHIWV